MAPEVIGGIITLYVMIGALTALFICTFNDDLTGPLTGPENLMIGVVWPISIVATLVIGTIRLVRRFDLI